MNLSKKIATTIITVGIAVACFAQTPDPRIRLNTIGFLPDFPKKATVAAKAERFDVVHSVSGNAVFSGSLDSVFNGDTDEHLWIADFSTVTQGGIYHIEIPGIGQSPRFQISEPVYKDTYKTMMLAMYLWSCGNRDKDGLNKSNGNGVSARFSGNNINYFHTACHLKDADQSYVGGTGTRDGTGGWHDAGDYNKYVHNSGVSVGMMLKAWEHFFHAIDTIDIAPVAKRDEIPAFLMEVKWNLDWVAKMQLSDGKVSHKLSTKNFGGNILPNTETETRYFVPWSTAATASFTAMMAHAARLYAPYDKTFADSCLAKARRSWQVLLDNPLEEVPPLNSNSEFKTGEYWNQWVNDRDDRAWAAAELWETTGEPQFLEYIEGNLPGIREATTWGDVHNLATLTYLESKRSGRNQELVETNMKRLMDMANTHVETAQTHGYGRTSATYYWGSNGALVSSAYTLNTAYRFTGDVRYRHATQDAISYLLGRNYFSRSFVTRVGHNPPVNAHCRRSYATKTTMGMWPGYLVGGPNVEEMRAAPPGSKCDGSATCYFDYYDDYARNEIAINWNTAMIYALAGLLPGADAFPAPPYPGQTVEIDVSVRQGARKHTPASSSVKVSRVVRVRGGKLDIPQGARVYNLSGRLIAERKHGAPMPKINGNGVYIIKIKN